MLFKCKSGAFESVKGKAPRQEELEKESEESQLLASFTLFLTLNERKEILKP